MHFFTELTVPSQASTTSLPFGPMAGLEETTYVTSSHFDLAATGPLKIFACQSGMMFIQESSFPDIVNVIIKPSDGLEIAYTGVKYYVYRGVRKDSFIDGSAITAAGGSKSDFINDFWANDTASKNALGIPLLPAPTPVKIGLDPILAGTVNVEDIFNNSQTDARAVKVKEGDWIGKFSDAYPALFEIITDTDNIVVDLDSLRDTSFQLAPLNSGPSSQDQFDDQIAREEVLAFIDPAAFYGMHYDVGVGVSGTSTIKKEEDLYNDILSLFATKNRVYFDIRGEQGYSYNFYKNYGDINDNLIQIKDQTTSLFVDNEYFTHKWPIYYTDTELGQGKFSKVEIKLRVDDNIEPLLFVRDKSLIRKLIRPNFIDAKKLLDGSNTDWTKEIKLRFQNMDLGASKVNVARHIQLQYFIQDFSQVSTSDVVFPYDSNDLLFANFDLPSSAGASDVFQHTQSSKHTLISGEKFSYVARPGVYSNSNEVVFYAQPEFSYKHSRENYPMPTSKNKQKSTNPTGIPLFKKDVKLVQTDLVDGALTISIISIANATRFGKPARKEDFFMLGITKAEYDSVAAIADAEDISKDHMRRIIFTLGGPVEPVDEIQYYEAELNIQGYHIDGFTESTELVGTGIFLYSLDGRAFNSKAFGDQSSLGIEIPDPGTLEQWKHIGRWEYDKEDSKVQNVHPTGIVSLADDSTNNSKLNPIDTELRGVSYYPSLTSLGLIVPSARPAIFVVHGNGQEYKQYEDICKFFAKNGFIATTISCEFDKKEFNLRDAIIIDPAYAPLTHFFSHQKTVYFYNGTALDADFGKLYVVIGTNYAPGTMVTQHVEKWIKDDPNGFTFTAGTPAKLNFKQNLVHNQGMGGLGRANLLYEHMKVVKDKFDNKIQNNIGLLGHSRGGESVVMAANEITKTTAPNDVHNDLVLINMNNINSVISLAPTHQAPYLDVRLERDIPYMVVYGSRDHDVDGGYRIANVTKAKMPTGISIYDQSYDQEKSLIFIHNATHNGFITDNSEDIKAGTRKTVVVDSAEMLHKDKQFSASKAYFNAHFRKSLYGENHWLPYTSGEIIPASVQIDEVLVQYEPKSTGSILVAEPSSSFRSVDIPGVTTSYSGTGAMTSGDLRSLDLYSQSYLEDFGTSPNNTNGINAKWKGNDQLTFSFTAQDISTYTYVSLRIANASRGANLKGVKIGLTSGGAAKFVEIEELFAPDERTDKPKSGRNIDPTKYAIKSVRVFLTGFGVQGISLTAIDSISVLFPASGTGGKVTIDNVLFTN
ncbi:MAG: hypothetical protein ACJASQ_002341 [Crocinitomicaceae bacterium]|jgi:hypothetical protein